MAQGNTRDPDSNSDDSHDDEQLGLFAEPEGFYKDPAAAPPTFIEFPLQSGQKLRLRLVGHNPLWGHHLWNSGRVLADFFQEHPELVRSKDVLELGAGAGLPGLVAGVLGARRAVITDYPDQELVDNLRFNVEEMRKLGLGGGADVGAHGYLWGAPPSDSMAGGFDLLVLGDLLFNHSEHEKLLRSVELNLRRSPDSKALVFFTPYRPWLLQKDLAFFDLARDGEFRVEKVLETVMPEVMFKEDRGDELLRRTVFGYELRWREFEAEKGT